MNGNSLVSFDKQLLDHIKNYENVQAKTIISEDLIKAHDEFGTLLHYAARYGNGDITKYLIELGSEVDAIGKDGRTPLIIALKHAQTASIFSDDIEILLEAKANIDIVDDSGKSALQIAFQEDIVEDDSVFKLFLDKVLADGFSIEESVNKLVHAGCTLYHATYMKDVKILECMLARGANVDSYGGWRERTALHAAVELDEFCLMKWLIDKGADVNVLDLYDDGPLFIAAQNCNKEMLQFLLEQGADANTIDNYDYIPPLYTAINHSGCEKQCLECVELLLQYGAMPQDKIQDPYTIFDAALDYENFQVIGMLIGHLAIVEKLGTSTYKPVIQCNEEEHREASNEIKKSYKLCQQTLDIAVFGTSTLFDLLIASDGQMKIHVRNETFLPMIEHFCSESNLSESCLYYYNKLLKSISRADYFIELDNTAIPVICKLLKGNYSQCYIAARKICDYLNEPDLVQLTRL